MTRSGDPGLLPGRFAVGLSEDRSGSEPDPRPLVLQTPLPGGAGLIGALADAVHDQADERQAARLALYALQKAWRTAPASALSAKALEQDLDQANEMVRRVAAKAAGPAPAQVSLSLLSLHRGGLDWVSTGQNSLLVLRDDELASLIEPGFPANPADAAYLGMDKPPATDRTRRPLPLRPGDRVLLCSRAITARLKPEVIARTLRFDAQSAADELVALAAPSAPGRARALVLSLAGTAAIGAGSETPNRNASNDLSHTLLHPPHPSRPDRADFSGLRLLRDPVWLAAGIVGLCAIALLAAALVIWTRPLPITAAPQPAPEPNPPEWTTEGAQPTQGHTAGGLPAEERPTAPSLPPRPLQYRDMEPVRN